MKYTEKQIEDGWRNYFSVANSDVMICGSMICHKCKNTISGDYLIQDVQNFRLRGNEHDERYLFHRKCSVENTEWNRLDKNRLKEIQERQELNNRISEVNGLITKYGLSELYITPQEEV
jgi:hypothetical protein